MHEGYNMIDQHCEEKTRWEDGNNVLIQDTNKYGGHF